MDTIREYLINESVGLEQLNLGRPCHGTSYATKTEFFNRVEKRIIEALWLDDFIYEVIVAAIMYGSETDEQTAYPFQDEAYCGTGRKRSSGDIWRHAIKYRDVTVEEVIGAMWRLWGVGGKIQVFKCYDVGKYVCYLATSSRGITECFDDEYQLTKKDWEKMSTLNPNRTVR